VCPWWGGYFIDNRFRRWLDEPVDFTLAFYSAHEVPDPFSEGDPMPIFRTLVLAVALLLCAVSSPAVACYAVIVGKRASADGSVLVGHNEENGGRRVLYFHKISRQQHPPGSVVRLKRGGQLAEVAESLAFLWSENPGLEFSDAYLNEQGVAVVSDACPTREDSYEALAARGEIRDGGIGYMLRRLVALRAKTAREAVDLIGSLVERFGYVDSGRTYVVADPSEAWVVAVVRGRRWVAQRVPDEQVVVLANVHVIGEVNLADAEHFRASADLVSYAAGRGWFSPGGSGPPFCFRAVCQSKERLAPDPRQSRGQALVTGKTNIWPPGSPLPFSVTPGKRLAVADVAAVLRDQAGRVPLFQKTTQEAAVFQLRAVMPRDLGCIYWRTSGRPDVAPLTPWYLGITETPESCHRPGDIGKRLSLERHFHPPAGTFDRDLRLGWWKFKRLEELVDEDGKTRSRAVRDAWSALESRVFAKQRSVEAEAWRRWQGSPDAARTYLTRYCADLAEEAGRQADKLSSGFHATQRSNGTLSRQIRGSRGDGKTGISLPHESR